MKFMKLLKTSLLMSKIKTLRLEATIHKLLSQAISTEINNSLIKTSVITAIKLSDDKSVAKIYIDCLILIILLKPCKHTRMQPVCLDMF